MRNAMEVCVLLSKSIASAGIQAVQISAILCKTPLLTAFDCVASCAEKQKITTHHKSVQQNQKPER